MVADFSFSPSALASGSTLASVLALATGFSSTFLSDYFNKNGFKLSLYELNNLN